MELIFGSLKVRFWAENPNERCMFCSASHPGAIACAAAQRVHGDSWELEYWLILILAVDWYTRCRLL
jgi:hypothetical protein